MNGHPPAIPRQGQHRYPIRVYYEDTDAGGVVYHATYLRFAERARTEALRDLGIPHSELAERFGVMFMVRRLEVDYVRSARVDESLKVVTETLAVGGATVLLRQDIQGEYGSCATLIVKLACVQAGGNKPGRIPARWRTALVAMRDARTGTEVGGGPSS